MLVNVISVLVILLLAGLFIRLTVAAWSARRGWIRWPGLVLAGLFALVFIAVAVVGLLGFYRMNVAPDRYTVSDVQVAMTQEQIARGEQLAYICTDCHSSTLAFPLDGSKDNFMEGGPPVGVLYASNLTPGGPLKNMSDGEVIRAIREGIDENGRPLIFMPSQAFKNLSDADVEALVAYLRSQPAVDRDLPEKDLNLIAAIFFGIGMVPTSAQEPITQPVVAPSPGTPAYGKYLVEALGCQDCHGMNLDGVVSGPGPGGGPDLTSELKSWSEDQFLTFFRSGLLPEGRTVDPLTAMPWTSYNKTFTDSDLQDIFSYLKDLPQSASTGVK